MNVNIVVQDLLDKTFSIDEALGYLARTIVNTLLYLLENRQVYFI